MYKKYQSNPDLYVFPFIIHEKNKDREIITYNDNNNGLAFRHYHEKLLIKLNAFPSSNNSYAYKEHSSTKKALMPHLESNLFIKMDIKSFFESITFEKFCDQISKYSNILNDANITMDQIKDCFYNDHVSLGYVTSPKISDMFLYDLDIALLESLNKFEKIKYSRYCDDILISTKDNDFGELLTFKAIIEENLEKIGLSLNQKKIQKFDLSINPSVHFLGLNISKDINNQGKNKISVSKSFILKTIDLIERLIKYKNLYIDTYKKYKSQNKDKLMLENNDEYLSYEDIKNMEKIYKSKYSIVNARICYIKYNSEFSYKKLKTKFKNRLGLEWNNKLWHL